MKSRDQFGMLVTSKSKLVPHSTYRSTKINPKLTFSSHIVHTYNAISPKYSEKYISSFTFTEILCVNKQFLSVAPCSIAAHHRKESAPNDLTPALQIRIKCYDTPPQPFLLQTAESQVSQPFLVWEMLQAPYHL